MSADAYQIAEDNGADLHGCHFGTNVVVCSGPRGVRRRIVLDCPTCKRRTPAVVTFDGVWYGHTFYCVNCLDIFMDGERAPRPFARNWRAERSKQIRELWDSALMPRLYEALVQYKFHESFCDDVFSDRQCETCDALQKEIRDAGEVTA